MIQFNWQEANKRKKGVITLEGLRLATSFVSLMRPVPLRFGEAVSMQLFVKEYIQWIPINKMIIIVTTYILPLTHAHTLARPPSELL